MGRFARMKEFCRREREAREQLGYIRPKEHLVIMVSPNTIAPQPVPERTVMPVQNGFWLQWWNIFFGHE